MTVAWKCFKLGAGVSEGMQARAGSIHSNYTHTHICIFKYACCILVGLETVPLPLVKVGTALMLMATTQM